MKRSFLHISFWILYLLQDMLLAWTWYGPAMGKASNGQFVWMAFQAAGAILPPKILLSYFLLRVSIKKIQAGRVPLGRIAGEAFLAYAVAIFLYRAASYYYVFPLVYGNKVRQQHLLDIPTVLVALIDVGFIAGLAVAFKFVRIQLKVKEREKGLVKEKLETELKFLRNQINPHFLLNTLNNIYALARKGSPDTAEVVLRLSELLQFMLYESSGRHISLKDEVKLLEGYLELEMIRYNDRLSVSFHKETDEDSYRITPLLLLPFVENAFKHGVSETRFESFIHIELCVKKGILHFMIENTCAPKEGELQKMNIGLNNVKRQLELTYKEYKLDLKNEDAVFSVHLTLNLESHVEI